MLRNRIKPVTAITLAIVIIAIFAVVGVAGSQFFIFPRYQLGDKDALLSDLKEYFAREPDIAVRIVNETVIPADNAVEYRYDLISVVDSERHGIFGIVAGADGRVGLLFLIWNHDGNDALRESGNLMLSGVADTTIRDWQKEDGQPNRNLQVLKLIDDNSGRYENWDLSERRVWDSTVDARKTAVSVFIEP